MTNADHPNNQPFEPEPFLYWGSAFAFSVITLYYLLAFAPPVTDWWETFYPITGHLLTPYEADIHYAYPPWTAVFLWPFGLPDIHMSRGIFGALTVLVCAFTIRTLGGKLYALILTLLSVPFFQLVINGQIDALPILGLGLMGLGLAWAEYLGVWLILAKPQIFAFALPVLWWNSERRWSLISVSAVIGVGTLLLWWLWPLDVWEMAQTLYRGRDTSIFPWGVPLGLALFGYGWWQKDGAWAAASTFFFAPYFPPYSLTGIFLVAYTRLPLKWALPLYAVNWVIGIYYLTTPLPA